VNILERNAAKKSAMSKNDHTATIVGFALEDRGNLLSSRL